MRSDEQLNDAVVQSQAWRGNAETAQSDVKVNRLELPSLERGKMSFSGNERNHLFLNTDGQSFNDISGVSGLDSKGDGRSFAVWDFDRDGRQDIALAGITKPVLSLYRNQSAQVDDDNSMPGNMFAIKFVGGNTTSSASDKYSSRDGYGVKAFVTLADQTLVRELRCGEGLAAQNSNCMLFGIGKHLSVDSIRIQWPSGKVQHIKNARAGDLLTIHENESETADDSGIERERYIVESAGVPQRFQREGVEERRLPISKSNGTLSIYVSMATWCVSCREHLPQLEFLREQYSPDQLTIIGVPVDIEDTKEKLTAYIDKNHPAYDLHSPWKSNSRQQYKRFVREHFGSDLMPATIFTDREGRVLEIQPGVPTTSDVERLLHSINNE